MTGYPARICVAALLIAVGIDGARAAGSDSFFEDLDRAEGLSSQHVPSPPSFTPPAAALVATSEEAKPAAAAEPLQQEKMLAPPAPSNVDGLLEKSLAWDGAPDDALAGKRLLPRDWRPEHAKGVGMSATPAGEPGRDVDAESTGKIAPTQPSAGGLPIQQPPLSTPTTAPDAPPLEQLAPLEAAVKGALDQLIAGNARATTEQRKEHKAIAFFYAARGFEPIWSKDGKAVDAVASLLETLGHAGDDGLTVSGVPSTLDAKGSLEDVAASEVALTGAVVAYARQATGSRVDPRLISPGIGLRPELADAAEVLDMLAAAATGAGDKLKSLNPSEPRYIALRDKLVSLRAARLPGVTAILPGPMLHIGMHDPRVPALRSRLHLEADVSDNLRYDSQLAQSVMAFQRANDLPPSGILTNPTVAMLSGGKITHMEGVLIANMEMWRWLPRDLGPNHIEVNVPDYVVKVFHDGQSVAQNRVVVGKVDTPTPLFSNTMKYLIVNPYWNVPQSIIKNEMLPKAGGDLTYLNDRGYSAEWHGGQWVVKQLPGPKNALGRIKFLFPNDYSVYLHDTPSKTLFSAAKRAFSHGCVRVDQPFAFGEAVLNAVPEGRKHWSEEKLEGLIGEKERYINLPVPLPIHIVYFTASIEAGTDRIALRDDIYGYAHAVSVALGQERQVTPAPDRKPRLVAEHIRRKPLLDAPIDDTVDPR